MAISIENTALKMAISIETALKMAISIEMRSTLVRAPHVGVACATHRDRGLCTSYDRSVQHKPPRVQLFLVKSGQKAAIQCMKYVRARRRAVIWCRMDMVGDLRPAVLPTGVVGAVGVAVVG